MGWSLVVGVIAGVGAIIFYLACVVIAYVGLGLIAGYHPPGPGGEPQVFAESDFSLFPGLFPWLLLVVPVVGGLLSGFIVFTFAPEAEGHGTDAAIDAYHNKQGYIRPIVPVIKIIASALTIGSGGSGGREGPIAQIGAGFGSFLGRLLKLRPVERRLLMAAGMGAGISAIFRAPLAGALFAAEVLYWSSDLESEVIIPAALASITAYCTFGLGIWTFAPDKAWAPLFSLSPDILNRLTFDNPLHLGPYLILALFVAVLAMLYTRSFYFITAWFHLLPIRPHLKPAIGAFFTGLTGVALYEFFSLLMARDQAQSVLAVLSFGYGSLQHAMTTTMVDAGTLLEHPSALMFALLLLAIALGKILTTGFTIGSGGSGGVFGPSMVIGGCGGGALGIVLYGIMPPGSCPMPASFVIVGMAGFFAAASKTPFSTLVMVSEMTGNYNLLLPTLWVCALAFLLSDEQSIYSSQVENRSRSPAHKGDYIREVLTGIRVKQFLQPGLDFPVLQPGDSLAIVLQRLNATDYPVLPVVDAENKLQGVTRLEEVYNASQAPHLSPFVLVVDMMLTDVDPLTPEDPLDRAMELFVDNDLLALPVVNSLKEMKVIGLMRRADVANAYLRFVHAQPAPDSTVVQKLPPL
jgi:CIC family chloride channel protein